MGTLHFFLLAGGLGTRTRPLSLYKPKPVFPLAGIPLLQIILDQLKEKGLDTGFINLHYLPEAIRDCVDKMMDKPDIHFLNEEILSGNKILKEAIPFLYQGDLLLTINADMFLEIPVQNMLAQLNESKTEGIILTRRNIEQNPSYKSILTEGKGFIGRKIHPPDKSVSPDSLMYTGVALLKPGILQHIDEINIFDSIEKNKIPISIFNYDGPWLDIGDPKSYMNSDSQYKLYIRNKHNIDSTLTNTNSLSRNVKISSCSVVENSIIWDNTEVKKNSIIRNCIITGNIILEKAHYENCIITPIGIESL